MSDGSDMDVETDSERRAPRRQNGKKRAKEEDKLDPMIMKAEDLIENDDLLCCIFVDTLAQTRANPIGVRYQQSDFLPPTIDTRAVLNIVRETVAVGDLALGMNRMANEVPAIRAHLATKDAQGKKRFDAHLMRYLRLYLPTSRVEIQLTERYKWHTGVAELAVYATQDINPTSDKDWREFQKLLNADDHLIHEMGLLDTSSGGRKRRAAATSGRSHTLALPNNYTTGAGVVMIDELKGAMEVVPRVWKLSLDVAQDMAESPEGPTGEGESTNGGSSSGSRRREEGEEDDSDDLTGTKKLMEATGTNSKGKRFVIRDHSLVQTASKGLVFLLGPGRFMNHDCDPHVVLHSTGSSALSFKVLRPIRIGDEITTFYGRHYFGRWNVDCLCSTCEKRGAGGFTSRERTDTNLSSPDIASEDAVESTGADEQRRVGGSDTEASFLISTEDRSGSETSGPRTPQLDGGDKGKGKEREFLLNNAVKVSPVSLARLENADLISTYVNDLGDRRRTNAVASSSTANIMMTPRKQKPTRSEFGGSETPSRTPRRAALAGREMTATMYHSPFGKHGHRRKRHRDDATEDGSLPPEREDPPDPPDTKRCQDCAAIVTKEVKLKGGVGFVWLCPRCQRHNRIYRLPWPARTQMQTTLGPPLHLRPSWWAPSPREYSVMVDAGQASRPRPSSSRQQSPVVFRVPSPPEEALEARERRLALEAAEAEVIFQKALLEANAQREFHNAAFAEARTAHRTAGAAKVKKGSGMWRRWEYAEDCPSEKVPLFEADIPLDLEPTARRTRRAPASLRLQSESASRAGSEHPGSAKILIRIPARGRDSESLSARTILPVDADSSTDLPTLELDKEASLILDVPRSAPGAASSAGASGRPRSPASASEAKEVSLPSVGPAETTFEHLSEMLHPSGRPFSPPGDKPAAEPSIKAAPIHDSVPDSEQMMDGLESTSPPGAEEEAAHTLSSMATTQATDIKPSLAELVGDSLTRSNRMETIDLCSDYESDDGGESTAPPGGRLGTPPRAAIKSSPLPSHRTPSGTAKASNILTIDLCDVLSDDEEDRDEHDQDAQDLNDAGLEMTGDTYSSVPKPSVTSNNPVNDLVREVKYVTTPHRHPRARNASTGPLDRASAATAGSSVSPVPRGKQRITYNGEVARGLVGSSGGAVRRRIQVSKPPSPLTPARAGSSKLGNRAGRSPSQLVPSPAQEPIIISDNEDPPPSGSGGLLAGLTVSTKKRTGGSIEPPPRKKAKLTPVSGSPAKGLTAQSASPQKPVVTHPVQIFDVESSDEEGEIPSARSRSPERGRLLSHEERKKLSASAVDALHSAKSLRKTPGTTSASKDKSKRKLIISSTRTDKAGPVDSIDPDDDLFHTGTEVIGWGAIQRAYGTKGADNSEKEN